MHIREVHFQYFISNVTSCVYKGRFKRVLHAERALIPLSTNGIILSFYVDMDRPLMGICEHSAVKCFILYEYVRRFTSHGY